jgi:hypothetical protein
MSSSSLPTRPVPTSDDSVPLSLDGRWWWDGSAWRRTVDSPWPRQVPAGPGARVSRADGGWRRGWSGRPRPGWVRLALVLGGIVALPLIVIGGIVAEILGRGLAAAVRVVVGVFALGVMVGLLALVFAHV